MNRNLEMRRKERKNSWKCRGIELLCLEEITKHSPLKGDSKLQVSIL